MGEMPDQPAARLGALLHTSADERSFPFPLRTYPVNRPEFTGG